MQVLKSKSKKELKKILHEELDKLEEEIVEIDELLKNSKDFPYEKMSQFYKKIKILNNCGVLIENKNNRITHINSKIIEYKSLVKTFFESVLKGDIKIEYTEYTI